MRKLISIIIVVIFFFPTIVFSQSCLPDGITFTTQNQVDSFQINYPTCNVIEGDLNINWSDITSLTGLNVLTKIEGDLSIHQNSMLNTLSGLQNIDSIYGSLCICSNDSLINLSGLNSITSIGKSVVISDNELLENLNGINNLTNISSYIKIIENPSLTSITGLENLNSISGFLAISNNPALLSLNGLDNINQGISDLEISDNHSLSNCAIASICNYLSSPIGEVDIYSNATGCNSPPEIANSCGFTMSCLPNGNYYLQSPSDIANFKQNYPNCEDLQGSLIIKSDDIVNLYGLSVITSVEKNLVIRGCANLNKLNGLGGLITIGEALVIKENDSLPNLRGLYHLEQIGDKLSIWGNNSMLNIDGIEKLTTINGSIYIWYNDNLIDISGIKQVDCFTFDVVSIKGNPELSDCAIQSICNAIYLSEETCYFVENSTNCNSVEEVKELCQTISVPEPIDDRIFSVYPNPIKNTISITGSQIEMINIYNQLGQKVITEVDYFDNINVSHIKPGLFLLEIITGKNKVRKKLIKK